jgi:hypothetical protein
MKEEEAVCRVIVRFQNGQDEFYTSLVEPIINNWFMYLKKTDKSDVIINLKKVLVWNVVPIKN